MTQHDFGVLRNLAVRYAEYANGPVMEERREKWRLHNTMQEKTFPFHIEDNGHFMSDLLPGPQCTDAECRRLENRLQRAILAYEKINDDRIIPSRFLIDWVTPVTPFCEELQFTHANDAHGGSFGYMSNHPIKDIDQDFHKIKKRVITLDRQLTQQRAEMAGEVFKDLLTVETGRASSYHSDGIANKAVHLLGMQELFLQMAMNPEAVHRLFSHFTEDNLALGQWEEDQGLLTANNDGNQGYCSGSSQYGFDMGGPDPVNDQRIRSADRCGYLEAQEATGVSPDMFGEFFMPQFRRLAAQFRMFKFGCCEPVHNLMVHLQQLPGLNKVSVTPWCDLEKLTETCRKDIIWSRKPVPLKLCGDVFDEADFSAHLQQTLDIGQDYFIEFVFRDTNRLTGKMAARLDRACDIVRGLTGNQKGRRD